MDPHVVLLLHGRADLAFHDLHGGPLYAHAVRALVEADLGPVVVGVDAPEAERVRGDVARWKLPVTVALREAWWTGVLAEAQRDLVLHDVLCPLVTADFLVAVHERARERPGTAAVGVRPVTDTLKEVVEGRIARTIDREQLVSVVSPVVVPSSVLADLAPADQPPLTDSAALVAWLRGRVEVDLVRAPSLARRVEHAQGVRLLECLDEVGHRVRVEPGRRA